MSKDPDQRRLLLEGFGRRVRTLREASGLTQDQLSAASKVHRVTIARVEAGKREVGLVSIAALAHALGLRISELLDGCDAEVAGSPRSGQGPAKAEPATAEQKGLAARPD